jgi:hypothetical protein
MRPTSAYSVKKNWDNAYWIATHPGKDSASTTLLYLGEMPEHIAISRTLTIRGSQCDRATIHVSTVNSRNEISGITSIPRSLGTDSDFVVTFPKKDAINVLLTVVNEQTPIKGCSLEIENLKLFEGSAAQPENPLSQSAPLI